MRDENMDFTGLLREGVRRNARRVVRPNCPHNEDKARHIERRDPCGHAGDSHRPNERTG
ncbi:MAG: hypothetical protein MJZ64_00955 [Paludibacteraceae bacterium]|nr:hypothetical protein [Paludibacteraceae bacterium]